MPQTTTNDALRWFNAGNWANYNLAFPNFGNNVVSANRDVRELVEAIQQYAQMLCLKPECDLPRAPEKGTVIEIIRLLRRANTLMGSRLIAVNKNRHELPHTDPAYESFLIYPAQYFRIKNKFLKGCIQIALNVCTAAMQHGDNKFSDYFTEQFVGDIWPELKKIQRNIAIELLGMTVEQVNAPGFLLDPDKDLENYKPEAWKVSLESWWVPDDTPRLTEDQWSYLTQGLPAITLQACPEWPIAAMPFSAGGGMGGTAGIGGNGGATSSANGATAAATFNLDTPTT